MHLGRSPLQPAGPLAQRLRRLHRLEAEQLPERLGRLAVGARGLQCDVLDHGTTIESIAMAGEGRLLWEPTEESKDDAEITRYMRWLDRGFETYDELWRWSVDDLEGFWASLWDYFGIEGSYERVLAGREMPGAQWFPGAGLNYAEHLLRQGQAGETAIVHASELRPLAELSWDELENQVGAVANGLRGMGVGAG